MSALFPDINIPAVLAVFNPNMSFTSAAVVLFGEDTIAENPELTLIEEDATGFGSEYTIQLPFWINSVASIRALTVTRLPILQ